MRSKVEHTFLCENDTNKLEFLYRAFPDACHIFTDMVDVAKGRARDFKKLGHPFMPVPEVRSQSKQNMLLFSEDLLLPLPGRRGDMACFLAPSGRPACVRLPMRLHLHVDGDPRIHQRQDMRQWKWVLLCAELREETEAITDPTRECEVFYAQA